MTQTLEVLPARLPRRLDHRGHVATGRQPRGPCDKPESEAQGGGGGPLATQTPIPPTSPPPAHGLGPLSPAQASPCLCLGTHHPSRPPAFCRSPHLGGPVATSPQPGPRLPSSSPTSAQTARFWESRATYTAPSASRFTDEKTTVHRGKGPSQSRGCLWEAGVSAHPASDPPPPRVSPELCEQSSHLQEATGTAASSHHGCGRASRAAHTAHGKVGARGPFQMRV